MSDSIPPTTDAAEAETAASGTDNLRVEDGEALALTSGVLHVGGGSSAPTDAPAVAAGSFPDDSVAVDAHADADGADESEADQTTAVEPAPVEPESLPLFSDLGLSAPLLRAIDEMGYKHPTPIQAQAIPFVLAGRDVLGVAQTGTGKTASFTLPLLDILSGSRARARMPRSLILEPTRELALQVAENFVMYGKYTKLTHALLIGGESMADQKAALNAGVDVLIATPGRLLDLFERGGLLMTQTRTLVIDEADRMLDMGFIPDVERIVTLLSPNRQTLFFSATMAPEIKRLADAFLQNPQEVTVSRAASVATTIVTGLALVAEEDKRKALRRLIKTEDVQNALIFCNRKRDVDMLHKSLTKHGFSSGALHGDLAQSLRFSTLEKFKSGEIKLLVCSDVAARGIDIGGLSHVFNFDVPIHAEDYVHRIGRTGRAGRTGHAYSIAAPDDRQFVEAIEKLIGNPIPPMVVEGIDGAEWSEGGRRGRGRGKPTDARGGRTGTTARRPSRDEAEPQQAAPVVLERQKDTGSEPHVEARTEARGERQSDRRGDRRGNSERNEQRTDRRPDRSQDRVQERTSDRPAGRDQERTQDRQDRFAEPRRDHRHRPDDLGPSVIGFGGEIPAFMLLPTRKDRVAPYETIEDDNEPDVD